MEKTFENNTLGSKTTDESSEDKDFNILQRLWMESAHSLNMLSTELQRAGYGRIAPDIIDTIRETYKPDPSVKNMFPSALGEALSLIRHEVRRSIQAHRAIQKEHNVTALKNTQQRLKETLSMYQVVRKAFFSISKNYK